MSLAFVGPVHMDIATARAMAAICAGLGLKRLTRLHHREVHGAQHFGQHVVGFDLQVIGPELDGHMPVAQVIGRAHEVKGLLVRRVVGAGCDAQHRLRCGHHTQERAVLCEQHVTAAHHGAARQEHAHVAFVGGHGVKAAFLANVPVQHQLRGALHQGFGKPLALGDESGDLQHERRVQNRK